MQQGDDNVRRTSTSSGFQLRDEQHFGRNGVESFDSREHARRDHVARTGECACYAAAILACCVDVGLPLAVACVLGAGGLTWACIVAVDPPA